VVLAVGLHHRSWHRSSALNHGGSSVSVGWSALVGGGSMIIIPPAQVVIVEHLEQR
jgi:hypothetical protein